MTPNRVLAVIDSNPSGISTRALAHVFNTNISAVFAITAELYVFGHIAIGSFYGRKRDMLWKPKP